MLVIEVTPGTKPLVQLCIRLNMPGHDSVYNYNLCGVIYLGQFHFTARMINTNSKIWSYDGQKNHGMPWKDYGCNSTEDPTHIDALANLDGRSAYLYVYAL